jgi:hypothetical protein
MLASRVLAGELGLDEELGLKEEVHGAPWPWQRHPLPLQLQLLKLQCRIHIHIHINQVMTKEINVYLRLIVVGELGHENENDDVKEVLA